MSKEDDLRLAIDELRTGPDTPGWIDDLLEADDPCIQSAWALRDYRQAIFKLADQLDQAVRKYGDAWHATRETRRGNNEPDWGLAKLELEVPSREEQSKDPDILCRERSPNGWRCSYRKGHFPGSGHAAYVRHEPESELLEKWR